MSLVKISRKKDANHVFDERGISRVPVLVGAYDQAAFTRMLIKPGVSYTPELFSFDDRQQLFVFSSGKGYITTPREAFNIWETAVFVPDFDREVFTVHASSDSPESLEVLHITAKMSDYDKKDMGCTHLTLPRFRGLSQCWTYEERFKGPGIKSLMLIEHRNLGRLSMGAVLGYGPSYVGEHIHNELEQWYYVLPGSSFTYTAEGEEHHMSSGDLSYTRRSSHHGCKVAEGEKFDYIWFELCEDGYPGGIS